MVHQLVPVPLQRFAERLVIGLECRGPRHDDKIDTAQIVLTKPEAFTNQPLEVVPSVCLTDLPFGDG